MKPVLMIRLLNKHLQPLKHTVDDGRGAKLNGLHIYLDQSACFIYTSSQLIHDLCNLHIGKFTLRFILYVVVPRVIQEAWRSVLGHEFTGKY